MGKFKEDLARDRAELEALRRENAQLASQVKRLVQAEAKLYAYQEQLDIQLKQYKDLYELNKRLAANLEIPEIFNHAISYIINSLGYERVAFFLQSPAGGYRVCCFDGYYDPSEAETVSSATLLQEDPLLLPLLHSPEYQVCPKGCDREELRSLGALLGMQEYLLCRIGPQERPIAFLALGNSDSNGHFYSRVTEDEADLVRIGNLTGLISSAVGNQLLYAGLKSAMAESKRTEESLIKLSLAVEQSPVTIVITDTTGKIEFVNPKFLQLTGYSREEVLGQNPSLLRSEFTPPEVYRQLWDSITAGKVWEGEFLNKKKNGQIFAEHATISPIRNREGVVTHYLAIKEDISERRQLEAQLFQSQKMESIGRLAGGVAHDFNNMLSVILGCVQLALLRLPEGDEKLGQYLDQIAKAAQRSSDITRQLLAFSRKEIISPKKVDLNKQIVETRETLARLIGEDINLTFKPVADIWSIKADPSQLDQILVNLAVNARDAMENGGTLAIETANVQVDRVFSQYHSDATPGEYVRLVVGDTGAGMDRETLSHIFEPFFTTKGVGKGTGLGLATVYGIVRQNNGFVSVYSEPGRGSTFKIYFPRYLGAGEEPEQGKRVSVEGSGRVLLVEDDPLVREMTLQMLEQIGYQVLEAETPEKAIELFATAAPGIDLVLSDVVMPKMSGKEMAAILERMRPDLKVVFMSGYTSDQVAQRGVVDQGTHFIQKPFDLQGLAEKLREALEG